MADENVQGTLSVGLDAGAIEKGMPKAASTAEKSAEKMGKAVSENAKKGKEALDQLGKAAELAEKRISASTKNAQARLTRTKTWAATTGTPDERAAAGIKLAKGVEEERRQTALFRKNLQNLETKEQFDRRVNAASRKSFAYQQKVEEKYNRALDKVADIQQKRAATVQRLSEKEKSALTGQFSRDAKSAGMTPSGFFSHLMTQQIAGNTFRQSLNQIGQSGGSASGAWQQAMNAAIFRSNVNAMQGGGGGATTPPSGGGRGGFRGFFGNLLGIGGSNAGGRLLGSLSTGLGIGVGGVAAARAIGAVVDASQQATAYDRQRVAAESLAGSQDKLNALMEAYEKASGSTVSKTIELSNVTRLLATGFAENSKEVERFVRATRGASIALGKPQDYIIQETQLGISNTSLKRLDQIGLGVKEVTDRIEELRDANKNLSREEAFRESVISLMEEKYGKLTTTVEGQASGVEKLAKAWKDLFLAFGQSSQGAVGGLTAALAKLLEQMGKTLEKQEELGRKAALQQTGGVLNPKRGFWGVMTDLAGTAFSNRPSLSDDTAAFIMSRRQSDIARHSNTMTTAPNTPRFNESQMSVLVDFEKRRKDIETQYNRQRLDEVKNYEQQRSSVVSNFAKQMAREEEDFFRQRARSQRDYERSIADAMREAQEREAEMREDLADTIADAREDSEERIAEIQQDYNEQREQAEKDHRERLMKAAGQLDAIAVLEERQRYKKEQEEAAKQNEKAISKQRDSLEKRIADAEEAFEEQLADAREADAKRLEDMRIARKQQLEDEDEDRAIRLERAAQDHQDQLDELDKQHQLRLQQIDEQAQEERDAFQDAFEEALHDADIYVAGLYEKFKKRDELVEKWFDSVIDEMESRIAGQAGKKYHYDPRTGPMIPYDYGSAIINSVPGNSFTGSTNNSKTIIIEAGAFPIVTTPGFEDMVDDMVEDAMVKILEQY